jgi:hypothetical protein
VRRRQWRRQRRLLVLGLRYSQRRSSRVLLILLLQLSLSPPRAWLRHCQLLLLLLLPLLPGRFRAGQLLLLPMAERDRLASKLQGLLQLLLLLGLLWLQQHRLLLSLGV